MLMTLVTLAVALGSCGPQEPPSSKGEPEPGYTGEPLQGLVAALEDPHPATRHLASRKLRAAGAQAVEPLLARAEREDTSQKLRMTIVMTLGGIGSEAKAAAPLLERYCESSDLDLRSASALALGRIDEAKVDRALAVLIDLLGEGGGIAADAAFGLGTVGPAASPAVPALVKLLAEGQRRGRLSAAYALGRIGPAAREAVPALKAALSDDDPRVAQNAREALRSIEELDTKAQ
jgi:HEAT repeat protein